MKRRRFLRFLAATAALPPTIGQSAEGSPPDVADRAASTDVDPYFLESGDLSSDDQHGVEELLAYQEHGLAGRAAIQPRGRPRLAPTYRFLKWNGELDGAGDFQGPLSTPPELPRATAYQMNAQILGFHGASDDWGGRHSRGTLTVEFRTRLDNEPMTWLFAQQFDVGDHGRSTLSLEYLSQRDGARDPVVTDDANVDLRIQLIRHRGRAGLLRKILQIVSFVVGLPTGGITGTAATFAQALPVIRVPRLLREGVAFSQALFGGMSEELPIWRSGFTTFALAAGGSRLGLSPGYWVAIDEAREVDLTGVQLKDLGGTVGLVRGGALVDANYLVISVEASKAVLTGNGRVVGGATKPAIEKELPMDEPVSRGMEGQ